MHELGCRETCAKHSCIRYDVIVLNGGIWGPILKEREPSMVGFNGNVLSLPQGPGLQGGGTLGMEQIIGWGQSQI